MDFQKRLKEIFEKYPTPTEQNRVIERTVRLIQSMVKREWAIYKRSLPVGLNEPIVFGLTEREADEWLERLKPKLILNEEGCQKIVHYYAKVRDDGYLAGVYDNPKEIVKEVPDEVDSRSS